MGNNFNSKSNLSCKDFFRDINKEYGFIAVSRVYEVCISTSNLTAAQTKLLRYIMSETVGWMKCTFTLDIQKLFIYTKLGKTTVYRELANLERMGVIIRSTDKSKGSVDIQFCSDPRTWNIGYDKELMKEITNKENLK